MMSITVLLVVMVSTLRLIMLGWTGRFAARSRLQLVDAVSVTVLLLAVARVSVGPALAPVWLVLMGGLGVGVAGILMRWRSVPWDAERDRSPRAVRIPAVVGTVSSGVLTVGLAVALM